ncbi:hypothetical protein K488DRAFT_83145 [Vararia minispora EC-137]|uniref:Uncharacterized protein n=1 Tax=Vararia minispora EC-137 TaxID=1314806 RepID=A0ACB8QTX2_9AGAM|nr:hypothetical protein K488DRAFT_83145 [Vararia minispora EC-137]
MSFFRRVFLWLSGAFRRVIGRRSTANHDSPRGLTEATGDQTPLISDIDAREVLTSSIPPSIHTRSSYNAIASTSITTTTRTLPVASSAQYSTPTHHHESLAAVPATESGSLGLNRADGQPAFVPRGPPRRRFVVIESEESVDVDVPGRAEGRPVRPIASNPKPRPRPQAPGQ